MRFSLKFLSFLLSFICYTNAIAGIANISEDDFCIGSKDAKVIIIEYFSLACPHCAELHTAQNSIFEQIKKRYIDKGIVLYVSRQLPTNQPSLKAAMITRCKPDRYFNFVDALLKSQNMWAFYLDYEARLLNIMKLSGMTDDEFHSCIKDEKLEKCIIDEIYQISEKQNIEHTPAMFINDQEVENIFDFKEIEEKIRLAIMDSKIVSAKD